MLAIGDDYTKDIESIMTHMQTVFVYQESSEHKFTHLSPLEAFYLRLIQNEYCGQLYDILKICKITSGTDYFVPSEHIKKMREFQSKHMSHEDVERFFEPTNVQEVAKYIILKTKRPKRNGGEYDKVKRRYLGSLTFASLPILWGYIM